MLELATLRYLKNSQPVKFIYSEKATKFCEISTLPLTVYKYCSQKLIEDFAKFCGLLRIYKFYQSENLKKEKPVKRTKKNGKQWKWEKVEMVGQNGL